MQAYTATAGSPPYDIEKRFMITSAIFGDMASPNGAIPILIIDMKTDPNDAPDRENVIILFLTR